MNYDNATPGDFYLSHNGTLFAMDASLRGQDPLDLTVTLCETGDRGFVVDVLGADIVVAWYTDDGCTSGVESQLPCSVLTHEQPPDWAHRRRSPCPNTHATTAASDTQMRGSAACWIKPTDCLLDDPGEPVWRHVRLRATNKRVGGLISDCSILPHPSVPYDHETMLHEIMSREA